MPKPARLIFRAFIRLLQVITVTVMFAFLYANAKLYRNPATLNGINADVPEQLHFLRSSLHANHAAARMQQVFPEGFVFTNALYGLATAESVLQHSNPADTYIYNSLKEIDFAIEQIDSPEGRAPFYAGTPLPYGMFYRAWLTYLQGRRLQIQPDSALQRHFQNNCQAIASAVNATSDPYLESYPGQAWPGDNIVGLAALALHDRIYPHAFDSLRTTWLLRMKTTADPKTGLLPHNWNFNTGGPTEPVRGSSQCLIGCFLPEIDSSFARLQYNAFKKVFLTRRLGLPGILEFPKETPGSGDIDSGPVVAGIGGVATIVGIRAAALNNDPSLYHSLLPTIDALLLPRQSKNGRFYLNDKLPVLDAFMVWCKTAPAPNHTTQNANWRLNFQIFSALSILLVVFFLWKTK